jgi:hypothetical protein
MSESLEEYLYQKIHNERPLQKSYQSTTEWEHDFVRFVLRSLSEWRGENGRHMAIIEWAQKQPKRGCPKVNILPLLPNGGQS